MCIHGLLNFYGLIADHKVAGWQPIRIQHLRSLPLIAQSAVEKTATLWSVINPEQFSNSWTEVAGPLTFEKATISLNIDNRILE